MDFGGEYIGEENGIASPEECAKLCQKDKNCDFFLYATENWHQSDRVGMCVFKKGPGDVIKSAGGALSGFRTCKFP